MKKILGALLLVITVAFTSNASANDNIPIGFEYVVSVNSVDFVAVATNVPTEIVVINVAESSVNYIASVEGLTESVPIVVGVLTNKEVTNDNIVASVEGLTESVNFVNSNSVDKNFAEVYLPNEVGLTNKTSYNGTNFAKVFLPNEVGLIKETLLI